MVYRHEWLCRGQAPHALALCGEAGAARDSDSCGGSGVRASQLVRRHGCRDVELGEEGLLDERDHAADQGLTHHGLQPSACLAKVRTGIR